jgi:hypothetical protein
MPPANRPLSWKEKRDRAHHSEFIGRSESLNAFRASLSQADPEKMIFSISGQGGVGKTTLLKQFRRITAELKQIAAYVNEGPQVNPVADVPESLYLLAKDLEDQGGKFDKFHERYKAFRQKKQELEADPEAPSGIAAGIGRFVAKAGLETVKTLPGGGMASMVDIDGTASKFGDLASFAWSKFRNKDEVQLVTEPEEVLTPLWLEEINRLADQQSEAVIAEIWRLSGNGAAEGLPLLITMMAESAPTSPTAIVDPCETAVERFLTWKPTLPSARLPAMPPCPGS